MKNGILTLVLLVASAGLAVAQHSSSKTVSLRAGERRNIHKITVGFLEVLDDSRCPVGTTCVWAGNAKVSLALSRGKSKVVTEELNSTTAPTAVEYGGYRFEFVDLTRRPSKPGVATMVRPELVLKVTRIKH